MLGLRIPTRLRIQYRSKFRGEREGARDVLCDREEKDGCGQGMA